MRVKPSPIFLEFQGIKFKLNIIPETQYKTNKTLISINCVEASKMIRQYVKLKYPKQFKVWVGSDKFAGGSSIDVNTSNFNGSPIDGKIFDTIEHFSLLLKAGRFDGMTDSYEYNRHTKSDNGTDISMYTKFISCYNSPKFGTKEYTNSKLNDSWQY